MADLVAVAAIGAPFTVLYEVIKEAMVKTTMFKPLLEELNSRMDSLKPLIHDIDKYDTALNRREKELEDFKTQMAKGAELIRKCSNLKGMRIFKKYKYSNQLIELQNSLQNLLSILAVQQLRDVRENLVATTSIIETVQRIEENVATSWEKHEMNVMKESLDEVSNLGTMVQQIDKKGEVQNRIDCQVPEPPQITVGLDVPLRELKMKLLKDNKVSMLVLTAPGGCGKTTLATMFCQDEEVKDKFKNNIFFVTVSKETDFNRIVQRLHQRKSADAPTFQDEVTAVMWLHKFLKEEEQNHVLLVLDDVWSESKYLLERFDEVKMPNFKILVTSRSQFPEYGSIYHLKTLNERDAMTLFRHSASLGDGQWNSLARKIVEPCKGYPLAIKMVGKSLRGKPIEFWRKREKEWSKGDSIIDHETEVLLRLQCSLDALDEKEAILRECFLDLGSFPEDHRIPAAVLIDMWAELYEELDKDFLAIAILQKLTTRSLANLVVRRNEKVEDDDYYSEHFVTQHDLLRKLAIYQTNLDPNRKRLFISRESDNLPKYLTEQRLQSIKPRLVSISSDRTFSTDLHNIQLEDVEVLVLNFNTQSYALPEFVEKMYNLKVLIVTNHGSLPAELSNFYLLDSLSHLKRIRLERVSIPSITKIPIQLMNLKKISLSMCSIGQAFSNCSFQISDAFPTLEEMNIDYSNDLVELPGELCNLVWLKKLSITNCHKLSALPDKIGKLVKLEVLRLRACTDLVKLPCSVKNLGRLNFLDISDCFSIELPEEIGELSSLRKINMRQCSRLQKLPLSVWDLEQLEEVICDEETQWLWEPFLPRLHNVEVKVDKEEFNLDWLQNPTVPERPPVLERAPVTVGLDMPLKDLKRMLIEEGVSRLVLTAPGGGGKTTLARKFFEDEGVKGIFKNNMFFVVASNNPSFELIVRELYRQKRSKAVPKNISVYEVAIQWLEKFLEEAGQNPLLLVLDDVWSHKLLDKFDKFKMSNYKFLVTSRYAFQSFGRPYHLKPLDGEDTMRLFCDSASFGEKISIPQDVEGKILEICKGFPLIIKVFGRSICKQPIKNLQKIVMAMSRAVIMDSETEVLICLQRSLGPLGKVTRKCFMDLGSFPEDKRISAAALIDMWSELYPELNDDTKCVENLYKLSSHNVANLEVTGKERG